MAGVSDSGTPRFPASFRAEPETKNHMAGDRFGMGQKTTGSSSYLCILTGAVGGGLFHLYDKGFW